MIIYTIKDERSEYGLPVTMNSEEIATRWFKNVVEQNQLMKSNPEDFSLWKIGLFSEKTGEMQGIQPELIIRAKDFI